MAGWLVKFLGSLSVVTIVGIAGGSIGHLVNKSQHQEKEKIQLFDIETSKAIIPAKHKIIKVPKGSKICKWLSTNGYPKMKDKKEEACRKLAERRLNVEFEFLN